MLDPVTVLTQLSSQLSTSAGMGDLLPALIRQMQLDSQTVKASTCTASTASALASNAGNGSAYPTLTLDGFNPPLVGSISSLSYVGKQSQLCVPAETMTLECVADSPNDGLTAGDEVWGWSGGSAFPQLCWQTEGSGVGPSIRTDNGTANILSNGGFTSWSGSLPLGWTLDSGTLGASLIQAGVEAQFVGGYPVVQISQALSSSQLTASRRYHISVMARASGVTSGTLGLTFSGGSGL